MEISRVYKIVNNIDNLIYVGSTTLKLNKRMGRHNQAAKIRTSKLYNHMRNKGFENFKIVLIKEYKDISKERLRRKENKYIKKYNTVIKGLNTIYTNSRCEHNKERRKCKECRPARCNICDKLYTKNYIRFHMKTHN